MLANIADAQRAALSQQLSQRDAGQGIIPSLALFRHVQQTHQYFRAMLRGHGREALWDAARITLSRTIEQALAAVTAENPSSSVPLTVRSQYLAGAYLNLLKWWLEANMPYSPEQMDAWFQQLALPGTLGTGEGKPDTETEGTRS